MHNIAANPPPKPQTPPLTIDSSSFVFAPFSSSSHPLCRQTRSRPTLSLNPPLVPLFFFPPPRLSATLVNVRASRPPQRALDVASIERTDFESRQIVLPAAASSVRWSSALAFFFGFFWLFFAFFFLLFFLDSQSARRSNVARTQCQAKRQRATHPARVRNARRRARRRHALVCLVVVIDFANFLPLRASGARPPCAGGIYRRARAARSRRPHSRAQRRRICFSTKTTSERSASCVAALSQPFPKIGSGRTRRIAGTRDTARPAKARGSQL